MAERLLLLRHARIGAEHAGRLVGSTDVPLEAAGQAEARAVSARLKREAPAVCYCSPLERCRQTALAVEMPFCVDPDLREIDFGRWENYTFAEASADDPSLVERWAAFAPEFAFPGGDSVGGFLTRVHAAADRLVQAGAGTVLAVTHGGVIRVMLCYLLGLEPRHYVAFDVGYAAMAVVDLFDGKGVLRALERPDVAEAEHG